MEKTSNVNKYLINRRLKTYKLEEKCQECKSLPCIILKSCENCDGSGLNSIWDLTMYNLMMEKETIEEKLDIKQLKYCEHCNGSGIEKRYENMSFCDKCKKDFHAKIHASCDRCHFNLCQECHPFQGDYFWCSDECYSNTRKQ